MKTKLYLLFFFVFPLFMSACRGDDPIPDPPVDGKRTVLVYMAADNSINPLASFTDGDLEELKAGMASIDNTSDMHLLVYIDTGFPRLIEIENKGGTVVETIVKEYEDRNSCGVAETQEVFNDVFGNSLYKAESYGLIYWSHGEGWIPTPLPSTRCTFLKYKWKHSIIGSTWTWILSRETNIVIATITQLIRDFHRLHKASIKHNKIKMRSVL